MSLDHAASALGVVIFVVIILWLLGVFDRHEGPWPPWTQ